MNRNPANLIALLKLHEVSGTNRKLFRQIHTDRRFKQRWEAVCASFQFIEGRRATSPGAPAQNGSPISAELVAGFVDGRLDDQTAALVESSAWSSFEILTDVADAFRFSQHALPEEQVPTRLSERLLQLGDSLNDSPAMPAANGLAIRDHHTRTRHATKTTVRRRWSTRLSVAAAVLVSCSLLIGYSAWRLGETVTSKDPLTAEESIQGPDAPRLTEAPRRLPPSQPNETKQGPLQSAQLPKVDSVDDGSDPPQAGTPTIAENLGNPQELDFELPDWPEFDLGRQPPSDPASRLVNLHWRTVKGLLAVSNPTSGHSVGYQYAGPRLLNDSFVTLPASWAEAELHDWSSQLVLDADSKASLSLNPNNRLNVQLDYGQVAFKSLPPESRLLVVAGPARWQITVGSQRTSMAVCWNDGPPRLMLRTGMATVDGLLLRRGQSLVWSKNDAKAERLTDKLAWFSKPETTIALKSAAPILRSDNLASDLRQIDAIDVSRGDIMTVTVGWRLSLFPDQLEEIFELPGNDQHAAAFHWLMQQSPRHPRGRRALQAIATRMADRQNLATVYRAYHNISEGAFPDRAVVERLLVLLNHDHALLRYSSDVLLTTVFGVDPVGYAPTDPPRQRELKSRQWSRWIESQRHRRRGTAPKTDRR